jgi:putative tricarboxylic transport membrane protein
VTSADRGVPRGRTSFGLPIAFLVGAGALLAAAPALAQGWKPDKNVEIVIGLTPGSSQDRTGRTLQKIWQDTNALGVTSTIVNRVGGGGQIAWTYLSQHAGDAHYVQIASPTVITSYVTGQSRFQFTDFTPLALLGSQYLAAAVRSDSPLASGRELLDRLKRDPYSLSLGVNSAGSALHILAGMLVKAAGGDPKKAKIAVFQGAELMTAGIGGHVDCIVTVASNILPHVASGKLRMLGVAAPRRLGGALASVPTWKEQGLDVVMPNWTGVFGVKGVSAQQAAFWDHALAASVATAEWKAFIDANQWEAEYLNSADYAKYLRAEDTKLRAALSDLGLAKQ